MRADHLTRTHRFDVSIEFAKLIQKHERKRTREDAREKACYSILSNHVQRIQVGGHVIFSHYLYFDVSRPASCKKQSKKVSITCNVASAGRHQPSFTWKRGLVRARACLLRALQRLLGTLPIPGAPARCPNKFSATSKSDSISGSQNNISMLPVPEQAACIDGMIDAAERASFYI